MTDRFDIDVSATPAQVWERLTTPEGLSSWFGTSGTIELRVGGDRIVRWGDAQEMAATITDVEPEQRLRLAYVVDGIEIGAEEWLITSNDTTTRLSLITSMPPGDVDDWDGFVGDVQRGWRLFTASLRFCLDDATAPNRVAECCHLSAPVERQLIWDALARWLADSPLVAGLEPALLMEPHSRLLVAADRSLLLDVEGSGSDRVMYVQAATHGGPDSWRSEVLDAVADVAESI